MTDTAIWTLIVITLNGAPHSSSYPTGQACHDAMSISLTGMTVSEFQKTEASKKEVDGQWYMTHPPHAPSGLAQRAIAKAAAGGLTYHNSKMPYHVTENGLIQDDPPATLVEPPRVKSARCIKSGE